MKKIRDAKYLFPIGLSCAALLAGCYSPDRTDSTYYRSTSYTPSSSYTQDSEVASTDAELQVQSQGATGSQTQQTTGSGEIQTERMVIPLHEEQVQVGKRTVETGTIRLRKQITTETVNQPVQIRKETVVVEREPASGTSTTQFQSSTRQGQSQQFQQSQTQSQSGSFAQPFNEGEIVVRLHSEEPVIEKRIVPAGQIVVETRVNNEQVNVQQQVRREKIDVDRNNAQNVIISDNLQQSQTREASGATQSQQLNQSNQNYRDQSLRGSSSSNVRSSELEYRAPVTTREYEPFPRPQPDGRETFPELNKDPERDDNR